MNQENKEKEINWKETRLHMCMLLVMQWRI